MKKFLIPLLFVFVLAQSVAQPPQSNNSNANGVIINTNQSNSGFVMDTTGVLLKEESVPAMDGVTDKNFEENAVIQQEIKAYKAKKSVVKSNSLSRSASQEEQVELSNKAIKIKGLAHTKYDIIEANVLYYDVGNYDATRAPQLMEALRLNSNHIEGNKLWLANSLVTGDTISATKALSKLDSLGVIPEAMHCYAADLMNSVPDQTTLITHGGLDTYSAFQEQMVNQRTSINVLSLDLLQSPQYRALLLKKGYSIPVQSQVDVTYLGDLIRINPHKRFAFSMTIPSAYLLQFQEELVPNGLVFLYPNSLDEEQVLINNEKYMDSFTYMDCGPEPEESISILKDNYLPMILTVEALSSNKSKEKQSSIESKKIKIRRKNK
jgi:hypothetical protein